MRISVIQFKIGDTNDIRGKGISLIRSALQDNPDLILLQELFNTIYFPQYEDPRYFHLAEEIPGETTDTVLQLIRGRETAVIAPLFEKAGESFYCSAALIEPKQGVSGVYRKLHLPSVKDLHENFFFKSGDNGHVVFHTPKAAVGVMLCYDRHFPESARLYGLKGADLLCVAAATPKSAEKIWLAEMQAHAFSNVLYLACSNRCGREDSIDFLGRSFICDYRGSPVAQAGAEKDEIITADIDIEKARATRRESPFYRDRRPDLYRQIAE
jgi:N-carbamoylputrescine amidase